MIIFDQCGRFWNAERNHSFVDGMVSRAMLLSLPHHHEQLGVSEYLYYTTYATKESMFPRESSVALRTELRSSGLTAITSIAMRLMDRFQPEQQQLALRLLSRAVENTPASTLEPFISWTLPKIFIYLKAFTDEWSIMLASRLIQMMLSTASILSNPTTIAPIGHDYLLHSIRHVQSASIESRWCYLTHFNLALVSFPVALLLCHLDALVTTLLGIINLWHYPIQVLSMQALHQLIKRVPNGMTHYTAMVATELLRMTIFYRKGRYDVSGVFNLDATKKDTDFNHCKVGEELLAIVVEQAIQLRFLNPSYWDKIMSEIYSAALEDSLKKEEKNSAESFVIQVIGEFQQVVKGDN